MLKTVHTSYRKIIPLGIFLGSLLFLVIPSVVLGANPELQRCPKAAQAFRQKDYAQAYVLAKGTCKDLASLARWKQLRAGKGNLSFHDYMVFDRAHSHWPWRHEIRKNAENLLRQETTAQDVVAWFRDKEPYTFKGLMAYCAALQKSGQKEAAIAVVRKAFETMPLTPDQEDRLITQFPGVLSQKNYVGRFNYYTKEKNTEGAKRQLRRCDPKVQNYLQVRLALQAGSDAAPEAYGRLPQKDQERLDILEDYIRYLQKKDSPEVFAFLKKHRASLSSSQERFWKLRYVSARDAILHKDYEHAVGILEDVSVSSGEGCVEPKFLQGFLACRFLKHGELAIAPLKKAYEAATLSHTKSRCAYWLGEAYGVMGDQSQATHWFSVAKKSPQTFYGQQAFKRLGEPVKLSFIPLTYKAAEEEHMKQNDCFRVLKILRDLGFEEDIPSFLYKTAKGLKTVSEKRTFLRYCLKEMPRHADEMARLMGMVSSFKETYPIMPKARSLKNPSLTHAIIRKESGFNPDAVSPVGARGLMQLMPDTATKMCKEMGCKVSQKDLTQKPDLNMKIGNYFLNKKLDDYDGNLALMLVAYNAGASYVRKWIERYGDPRKGDIDTLTWIELIPFTETRDYLRRVMADQVVYDRLLKG